MSASKLAKIALPAAGLTTSPRPMLKSSCSFSSRIEISEQMQMGSFCETPLPRGRVRGQSYFARCPPAGAHRIRMDFRFLQRRWHCEFWDADAGMMLPVRLHFEHADSLYTLARRGRGFIGCGRSVKFGFFNAIGAGHGAISLTLDELQYQALRVAEWRMKAAKDGALADGK